MCPGHLPYAARELCGFGRGAPLLLLSHPIKYWVDYPPTHNLPVNCPQRLLHAISLCISWPIVIRISVRVHIGQVRRPVPPVTVKETVGLCHPHGLLVVFSSRTGAVVKGAKLTEAAVWEMTESVFRTSTVIHAISFYCVSCLAGSRTVKSRGTNRHSQHQHKYACQHP